MNTLSLFCIKDVAGCLDNGPFNKLLPCARMCKAGLSIEFVFVRLSVVQWKKIEISR